MAHPTTSMLQRERYLILGGLLVLAALAWVFLIWQSSMMSGQAMGLTMGMGMLLFIAIWIVMMVAMMFPTAAPMILMFTKIYASKRQQEHPFVPTWVFVSAYLLVWSLCGVVAYPLAMGIEQLAAPSMWLMENAARLGGVVLAVAGLYQLSPMKDICLSKCRTPLQFILSSWHDGYGGAFRMGLEHGTYCLGCCWLLFVILFPLGIMNIAVMALVTALIFAEKALPIGRQVSRLAGGGLVVYGVLVMFLPAMLPIGMR
jgi:predicted metal-binding membrane protein